MLHLNIGGPIQAESDMKLEIDVAGSLVITKVANSVAIITTLAAKCVSNFKWDYSPMGGECETSHWVPSTWGWPQEFIRDLWNDLSWGR